MNESIENDYKQSEIPEGLSAECFKRLLQMRADGDKEVRPRGAPNALRAGGHRAPRHGSAVTAAPPPAARPRPRAHPARAHPAFGAGADPSRDAAYEARGDGEGEEAHDLQGD